MRDDETFIAYVNVGDKKEKLKRYTCFVNALTESILHPNGNYYFSPPNLLEGGTWEYIGEYGFHVHKINWVTDTLIEDCGPSDKNYFIHIESKWKDGSDTIRLYVHFETHPYRSEKDCTKYNVPEDNISNNRHLKHLFTPVFYEQLGFLSDWTQKIDKLQIAVCETSAHQAIKQIKKWFETQTSIAEKAIDETIKKVLI